MKRFTFVYWKKDGTKGRWSGEADFKEELSEAFYQEVETESDFDELDTVIEEEIAENQGGKKNDAI